MKFTIKKVLFLKKYGWCFAWLFLQEQTHPLFLTGIKIVANEEESTLNGMDSDIFYRNI